MENQCQFTVWETPPSGSNVFHICFLSEKNVEPCWTGNFIKCVCGGVYRGLLLHRVPERNDIVWDAGYRGSLVPIIFQSVTPPPTPLSHWIRWRAFTAFLITKVMWKKGIFRSEVNLGHPGPWREWASVVGVFIRRRDANQVRKFPQTHLKETERGEILSWRDSAPSPVRLKCLCSELPSHLAERERESTAF